eukprot:9873171-Lingulodinium_polyedra.AAC.1
MGQNCGTQFYPRRTYISPGLTRLSTGWHVACMCTSRIKPAAHARLSNFGAPSPCSVAHRAPWLTLAAWPNRKRSCKSKQRHPAQRPSFPRPARVRALARGALLAEKDPTWALPPAPGES